MDLHALGGGAAGGFAGVELAHRSLGRVGPARVAERRRAVHQEARGVQLGGHVGHHPAQRLEVGDGLAERLALLRIGDRLLQRAAPEPDAERPDGDPSLVEDAQRVDEPVVDLADAVLVGHQDVLEDELGGVAGAQPP